MRMRRVFLLRNFCNSSGITNRCTPTHTATLVFVYRCAPLYTKTLSAVCAGERGVMQIQRIGSKNGDSSIFRKSGTDLCCSANLIDLAPAISSLEFIRPNWTPYLVRQTFVTLVQTNFHRTDLQHLLPINILKGGADQVSIH